MCLLPTGSEERGVFWVVTIPVTILSSCPDLKTIELWLHKHNYSLVVKIRNTSEEVLRPQNTMYCDPHTPTTVFLISIF